MYQLVFTKLDRDIPFTLHTVLPRVHEIRLSMYTASDLLSERSVKGSTVMVQDAGEADLNEFLDLLDEVGKPNYNY